MGDKENIDVFIKTLAKKIVAGEIEDIEEIAVEKIRDKLMQDLKNHELVDSVKDNIVEEKKRLQTSKFYYDKHTWVKVGPNLNVKVGLTTYALGQLKSSAKIYIDKDKDIVRRIEPFGAVDVFDLYSPIAGTLVSVNSDVLNNTEKINPDTWLIEVKPIDYNALIKELEVLMDEKKYNEYTSKINHGKQT